MRKVLALLLVFFLAIPGGLPARAQSTARADLFGLDTSAFPTFSSTLDVFDASGNFVSGLTTGQLSLLEDSLVISPASLRELQPGAQFALALDPGPFFAFRGSDAVSRLDKVINVLQSWLALHPDSFGDDLSLVPNGGSISNHLSTTAAFKQALSAYQPNLLTLTPSLDTLSGALDAISNSGMQPGMKRAILYITSPPETASIPALQNLTQRAISLEVRVHVWIVSSTDFYTTSGATALKDLSILTGGTYALFSGVETLPDPEVYLTPLRHTYSLGYITGIRTAGTHSLAVQVVLDGGTITSNSLTFDLSVEPPNPILVTPPGQIVRQGADPRATDLGAFLPISQEIEAILEFPDGMPRPFTRTALYVDGMLADENTSDPFDTFTWDLSGLTQSGDHILQILATDTLGLEKVSQGVTVTVTIIQPEGGTLAFLARNRLWVTIGAVCAAGLTLAITLLAGRKKAGGRAQRKSDRKSRSDPLTAEVDSMVEKRIRRPPRGRAGATLQPEAYLQRLREDGQPVTTAAIPITSAGTTIGSDPFLARCVLDDPSVSPLHARLGVYNGQFVLIDEKSIAGTWVNHELLSAPCQLRHGDVVHFGATSYRFMLRDAPEIPAPRIIPLQK